MLIIAPLSSIETWYHALHAFTFFKVAILSGSAVGGPSLLEVAGDRRDQWQAFLGPPKAMFVGEYEVYLLSVSSFRNRSAFDNCYLHGIEWSAVVIDDFFAWAKIDNLTRSNHEHPVLHSFPSSRELRDGFSRFNDLRCVWCGVLRASVTFVFSLWELGSLPETIPTAFIESFSGLLLHASSSSPFSSNQQLLHDYYNNYTITEQLTDDLLNNSIPSFLTCFSELRFHCDSFSREYIIPVPVTVVQARCLQALSLRWGFILNGLCVQWSALTSSNTSFDHDVLLSIYLELLRVYTHPFLAGCSQALLLQQHDFCNAFRNASGKVVVLDQIIASLTKVEVVERLNA